MDPPAKSKEEEEPPRRNLGRPSGSKNKPKPPIILPRESPAALRTHVMEIPGGCDVTQSLSSFSLSRQRGIFVLSGSGAVTDVTLKHPSSPSSFLKLHGTFELLSLTGYFLSPLGAAGLAVYLAGGEGKVVGGSVAGALMSSGPVVVMAASFGTAVYERLPLEEAAPPPDGVPENFRV